MSDPDSIVRAAAAPVHDQRIQRATAIRYSGAFADEPEIAQALANSNAPAALALRAFQGYKATKNEKVKEIAAAAGYGQTSLKEDLKQAAEVKAAVAQQPQEEASWWDTLRAGAIQAPAAVAGAIGGAAKNVGEGLLEGLNYIVSPLTASAQAGYASDNGLDKFLSDVAPGNPMAGAIATAIGGVTNTLEGAAKLAGVTGTSTEQQGDMRQAGYNPDSAASRYSYYFQEMGNKRAPVSDAAVARLKADERWNPTDVDAAREIVSSGALNDLARSADSLSPQARDLLTKAGSDKNAELLLTAMADHSQLTFGGSLVSAALPSASAGDTGGQGSVTRTVGAALADLVGYWYADPLVAVGAGVKAVRGAEAITEAGAGNILTRRWAYGVNAQSIDDVTVAIRATDDNYKPIGAVATRFDQAMHQADQIVRLQQSGKAEDAIEAGRQYAAWTKQFPSMRTAFDTLVGMRSGAIGSLTVREGATAAKEADRATTAGRNVSPWMIDAPTDGTPLWSFVDDTGAVLDDEAKALQRAKVADEMSAFILAEAYASGRELTHGRILMPGQMSLNGALRNTLGKFGMDLLLRRDKSAMRQLAESKGTINLNNGVSASPDGRWDQLLDTRPHTLPGGSKDDLNWLSHNYTFGISHMFSRGWRTFERTFSNKTINPLDPNSTKVYGQFVNQFMPKRQAQMVTTQYTAANPGERYAMLRNTVGSFLNVMHLRNTPEAQALVEQMTKGLIPTDRAINGYKAGGNEWYTMPSGNEIRVGDFRVAAAVHPWQLNEGLELPNWREVRSLVDRGKVLNAVLGTVGPWASSLNQVWKASKTASYANAARQAIEGFAFTAVRNPEALPGYRDARKAVKADVLQRKVNDNDLTRLANSLSNLNAKDLDTLETVRRSQPHDYVVAMKTLLTNNNFDPDQADVLARLSLDIEVDGIKSLYASSNTFGVARLAMAGPLDFLRRVRAERLARKGGEVTDSPMSKYLDEQMVEAFTENAFKQLGDAADSYVTSADRIDRAARQEVFSNAGKGLTMRPAKVRDGYKWLGAKAEISPNLWHGELDKRLADEVDGRTLRYIAQKALDDFDGVPDTAAKFSAKLRDEAYAAAAGPAEKIVAEADKVRKLLDKLARARTPKTRAQYAAELDRHKVVYTDPQGQQVTRYGPAAADVNAANLELIAIRADVDTDPLLEAHRYADPDTLTAYMLGEHELGQAMRNNSARMQYLPNGDRAVSDTERLIAAEATARTAVNDLAHHLGGIVSRDPSGRVDVSFAAESRPLLEKIAAGERPTPDDLAQLPREVYPEGLVHTLHTPVPGGEGSMAQRLANLSSRAYGAVVAKPLAHMVLQPLFLAEKRIAYGQVEPLMQGLVDRGLSQGQAAFLLESMANNRAINRTFLATDNPAERSVFSELGDKYLMFMRAQEDFVRRFIGAAQVNPGALGRAHLMMTSAVHAGAMHYEPQQDENGNTVQRLTFTYPGSALAQRVLMDGMVSMGLAPDEVLRIPQFDGLKSQVRFINPGVSNPLQFSVNPVFGWAIDGLEKVWPANRIELERLKRGLQGGEDFGGGQSTLQMLTPSMFQRFVPLMQRDDADGQFASAFRTATIYAEAAGQLPGPDASPEEKAKALDAVKASATNILILRAFTGAFLPASPQNDDPDIGEMDVLGRLQELPNIRSEWFQVKSEMAAKYPDNYSRALSEAQVEFARRYPGELVVNAAAFGVGTNELLGTGETGESVGAVPYTLEGTRWLLDNLEFVKANPTVALALMPRSTEGGDFNNEAYKLQLKSELRKHKPLEDFYRDVALSDDISEYWSTVTAYRSAANENPAASKGVYSKLESWQDGWRRTHPLASAEIDRRAEPNFVHAEMAPALERLATGQASLPATLEPYRAQLAEMHQDYATYRDRYLKVDFFANGQRASLNSDYRKAGNEKWLATPLEPMWKLMNVYEVN